MQDEQAGHASPGSSIDASSVVPDPLTPDNVRRRQHELRKIAGGVTAKRQLAVTRWMLAVGVCLGVLVGEVTGSPLALFLTGLFGALTLAVGQVWWQMAREERASRELRGLRERWTITAPGEGARALVAQIADDIGTLPPKLRADFAPLMSTVRECCTALGRAPDSDRYLSMLRERAVLVHQVRAEYAAVVAVQRDQEAMDGFSGDLTGHDLTIVTQVRDALASVRANMEMLAFTKKAPEAPRSGYDEADSAGNVPA